MPTLLADTPYNKKPKNAVSGITKTTDGISLRFAHWRTVNPPNKGTVILLHGRAEYIEKQYETIEDLIENGFDVLSFDWRGQGGSERMLADPKRGFIEHFDQYILDLETILSDVALPDCRAPFYILAHSTGALISLLAAPKLGNRIRRLVLSSPLLKLSSIPLSQSTLKWLCGSLHVLGLGDRYIAGNKKPTASGPFTGNKLTSDMSRFQRSAKFAEEFPDKTIGGPTASWLFAAIRAMEQVNAPEFHTHLTIPTLFICAGKDQVVDNLQAEHFADRMRSGSCLTIPGAEHELLQERDVIRAQLLAAFYAFVPGGN